MEHLTWALVVVMLIVCGSAVGEARLMGGEGRVELKEFGKVKEGRVVEATLRRGPMRLHLINWGARITQLHLPDVHGNTSDVVLGFDSFRQYEKDDAYFGAVLGRVANRIAGGTFRLNHVRYNTSKNAGNNTLHGGKRGFDKVLWDTHVRVDKLDGTEYVEFTHHSADGDQGFPGDVHAAVSYRLTRDMGLVVHMAGVVGKKSTPLNLAQNTYWNLGGHNSGTILNHTLEIASETITPVDKDLLPTGRFERILGTPFDFTRPTPIATRFHHSTTNASAAAGYDINYVLDRFSRPPLHFEGQPLHLAATLREPRSHRAMELYTNQPALQLYTANALSAGVKGKQGASYGAHHALCLDTQGFPDAVHHPNFPSVVLAPGHVYRHTMLLHFSFH